MSSTERRQTFEVRGYDCDGYGHLNNTAYLRYLEELESDGPLGGWHLLHVDITYDRPVDRRAVVDVSATGSGEGEDWRKQAYKFASAGQEVASAEAVWGRSNDVETVSVEKPPGPPAEVYRHQRGIRWRDIDGSRFVSPASLSAFAEDCGVELCAFYGWPMERCAEAGFAMILRRHQILFEKRLALGDDLTVESWASDLRRASAIRHYLFSTRSEPVARFRSRYVWADVDTMRPIRIPDDFLADFRANFAGETLVPSSGSGVSMQD